MATNVKYTTRSNVNLELTFGGAKSSGAVELLNQMPVLLLEATDSNNKATCECPFQTVVELSVTGADAAGNAAVAIGHKIFRDGSEYNRDATNGTFIGYALGAVSSGATTAIEVGLASA